MKRCSPKADVVLRNKYVQFGAFVMEIAYHLGFSQRKSVKKYLTHSYESAGLQKT